MTLSPRQKLAAAALCLLAVPVVAAAQGASAAGAARVVLGLTALAGLALWCTRRRGVASKFKAAPRLQVVQRAGLSQRNGVALIEVDGRSYLVVHGDGFARLQPVRKPRHLTPARSPLRRERALMEVGDEC